MTQESELPQLTDKQLDALRRFASFEIGIEEMRRELAGVFEFNFATRQMDADGQRWLKTAETHFRVPEPGIVITRKHIENALELKRSGVISERELVHWATILLMNDAYALDPGDEDLIADWLNDISVNLDAS